MVVFVVSWQFIPFHSLIYQGGVRQIPRSMYEAAELDGAGRLRQFFSITLPQLKYTIITSSTLMVVGSLTYFDLIFVLTGGGPGDATRVLALDMYKRGFQANLMGPASAIAVILVLVGLGLALLHAPAGRQRPPTASWRACDGHVTRPATPARAPRRSSGPGPPELAGRSGLVWLAVVVVPLYWIVITSFKLQRDYFTANPFGAAGRPDAGQLPARLESDFARYFLNSASSRWAPSSRPCCSFMAAYAIVRGGAGRFLRSVNALFLMGLAIPLQAVVIPVYLIIIRMRMYDTLMAIILPSIAFAIPLSVLVLANFIRDIPQRAVRVDAARRRHRVGHAVAAWRSR